ncbi:MAG: hypothetical protein OWQ57_11335 [Sulfobacillus sp.]|nr:hypothetical protein [Sulfobacillus sp.]
MSLEWYGLTLFGMELALMIHHLPQEFVGIGYSWPRLWLIGGLMGMMLIGFWVLKTVSLATQRLWILGFGGLASVFLWMSVKHPYSLGFHWMRWPDRLDHASALILLGAGAILAAFAAHRMTGLLAATTVVTALIWLAKSASRTNRR